MTREERLKWLKEIEKDIYVCSLESTFADDAKSCAIHSAIQELEQEPCEDAISRDELLKAIDTWDKFGCNADTKLVPYQDHYVPYIHYDDVVNCIKGMPPVNPQPKTGHWEWVQYDSNLNIGNWHCSECKNIAVVGVNKNEEGGIPIYKYCPNCGARMVKTDDFDIKMHCRSYDCKMNKCTRGYDLDCDDCIHFRTF